MLCAALLCTLRSGYAQGSLVDLSEREVEEIRDASIEPVRRVMVYQQIVDRRVTRIQEVLADTRGQGRTQDLHDQMEQISGLVNEIEDNLADYDKSHRDVRKALPKLADALVRWESVLKQPPENEAYALTRKLALESVADLRDETKDLLAAQTKYFKDHPPAKEAAPQHE